MQILDVELDVEWIDTGIVTWVGDVIAEPSQGGVVEPVSRQSRPLFQATLGTWDVAAVQTMFMNTNCGEKGFLIRPPDEDLYLFEGVALGTATGLEQEFQLQATFGTLSWDALYVDDITLYANGVAIPDDDWSENLGLVTLEASSTRGGQAIAADFANLFAVRFVEPELEQTIVIPGFRQIQTFTVREVFVTL